MNADSHPDIGELARALWGEPNMEHSTKDDVRFGRNGSKSVCRSKRTWFDHEAGKGGGYNDLYEKVHGKRPASDSLIIATYDYHDEHGELIFQVVRKLPKKFVQRRPNGSGGWIWNMNGVQRVPYRLPELMAAPDDATVYIVEGEKDSDALHACGLIATTNAGGAGKWWRQMSEFLRGRQVIILPDFDEAGEKHAADVVTKLKGIARSV
ncbi:MAG: hypothetical protein ABSA58_15835, partial [Acetobacteraceae bacterium]